MARSTPAVPHVLVVEDEEIVRDVLAMVFTREGFRTSYAATVAEGLAGLSLRPTHVTLDLHLPDGQGTQVLRHVRQERLPVRVAVTTGTIEPGLLAAVSRLGPDQTFQKPFRPNDLVAWVRGPHRQAPHSRDVVTQRSAWVEPSSDLDENETVVAP